MGDLSRVGDPCGNARVTARVGFLPHLLAGGVVSLVGVKGDDMKIIERLRELEKQATAGPLVVDYDKRDGGVDQIVECRSDRTLTVAFGTSNGNEYDLPLLAETRNALPAMLAVAEAAERLNKALCHGFDAMAAGSHEGCIVAEKATYKAQRELDTALRAMEGGA